MVLRAFLWLLAGYFAVIGLVQAAAWVVGILFPPKVPKGCRLILAVEEDADYTESGLHGCCRLLCRGETGGLPYAVLLPRAPEAREICRRYCRDRNIETLELLPPEKWCMIEKIGGAGAAPAPGGENRGMARRRPAGRLMPGEGGLMPVKGRRRRQHRFAPPEGKPAKKKGR